MARPTSTHGTSIRSTQIVLIALASGVVIMACTAVFLRQTGAIEARAELEVPLTSALGLLAASSVGACFVIRKQALGRLASQRAETLELVKQDRLPPQLSQLYIVGGALAESVGLFGSVVHMLTGNWYALAAPILSTMLIVAQVPTRERVEVTVRSG